MRSSQKKKAIIITALCLATVALVSVCVAMNTELISNAYHKVFGYEINGKSDRDKLAEAIRKQENDNSLGKTDEPASAIDDMSSETAPDNSTVNGTKKQIKMTTDTIEYVVRDYYLTDILPEDVSLHDFSYYTSKEIDEDGKLQKSYRYLVVDTTVQNISGENNLEYLINSFSGEFIADDYIKLLPVQEFRYFSRQGEASDNPYEGFHYIFEKDELIEAQLIFILDITAFEEGFDFYFELNQSGAGAPDENYHIQKAELDLQSIGK